MLDGETTPPEPEPPPSTPSESPPRLALRLPLRTALVLVVIAALATAAFVKVRVFFDPKDTISIDGPAIFVIAVALCGIAIGGLRRYPAYQTLAHVGAAYGLVVLIVLLAETHERLARYWLEIAFAGTAAIPLGVQGFRLRHGVHHACAKRTLKRRVEAVVLANLNVLLAWLGVTLSLMVAEQTSQAVERYRAQTPPVVGQGRPAP